MNKTSLVFFSIAAVVCGFLLACPARATLAPAYILSVQNGRVTLSTSGCGADLATILEDLAKQAGFEIAFYERPSLPFRTHMEDVPVEECLKKILPSYSLEYRKKAGGSLVLSRVAVFRVRPLDLLPAPSSGIRIAYGQGRDQLGIVSSPGVERQGPASFAADDRGNYLVCDTVNQEIKIFATDGKLIRAIAAPLAFSDIDVDRQGNILVLDALAGRVALFDPSGKSLGSAPVAPDVLAESQNIRAVNGRITLLGRDQQEFDLGGFAKGELSLKKNIGIAPGLRGESGRSYTVSRASDWQAEMKVADGEVKTVGLPIPRLASIAVLGEDAAGNVYLQVEQSREKGPGVDLGVIKLDADLNPIAMIEKIPNNYASWTARLLTINRAGDVFQMLPGSDGVALNRWNWERKGER